jgi:hypothetical protein
MNQLSWLDPVTAGQVSHQFLYLSSGYKYNFQLVHFLYNYRQKAQAGQPSHAYQTKVLIYEGKTVETLVAAVTLPDSRIFTAGRTGLFCGGIQFLAQGT